MRTPWAAGSFRHCLCDSAHAAYGMAPHAFLPVHFAEDVMEKHIGGARRVGTREAADYRVEAEHGLDGIGVKPVVHHGPGRLAQQPEHRPPGAGLPQPLADRGELAEFAYGAALAAQRRIGRRAEHKAAQDMGNTADLGLVGGIARGIAGAELRNFAFGASLTGEEMAPVR
jgi:hypothetical protein